MKQLLKKIIPPSFYNYYRSFRYRKEKSPFYRRPLVEIFQTIFNTNHWQGIESICGETSGIKATETLREGLNEMIKTYQIQSILDIACGDFVWMNAMNLENIDYLGMDIVEEMILSNRQKYEAPNIHFEVADCTSTNFPKRDVVICRDALVHLSFSNIEQVIHAIKESGSTYFICTTFTKNRYNFDIVDGDWRTLNMQKPPFSFPKPLKIIYEGYASGNGAFLDKAIGLWEVEKL